MSLPLAPSLCMSTVYYTLYDTVNLIAEKSFQNQTSTVFTSRVIPCMILTYTQRAHDTVDTMSKPISAKKESKVVSVRMPPDLLAQIEARALDLGMVNPFAADGEIKPNVSAYLLNLAKADLGQGSIAPAVAAPTAPAPDPALASTVAELLARVEALEKPDGAIA